MNKFPVIPIVFAIVAANITIFNNKSSRAVEGFPNSFTNGEYLNSIPGEMSVEIKGKKYQYSDETGTNKWRPINELKYIRKDVFRLSMSSEKYYFCLKNPKIFKENSFSSCTARGWRTNKYK